MTSGDDTTELDPFLRELAEAGVSEVEAMEVLLDSLEPAPLPSTLRARILDATQTEGRFAAFAAEVAKLVDVAVDTAKELLLGIDREESWGPAAVPVMQLYNFDGGPAVANAIAGFVRMPPGSEFPHHSHLGEETVLVLQGRYQESDGHIVGPGEIRVSTTEVHHSFEVLDGPELIYLVVVHEGIQIGDQTFRHDDPLM